MSLSENQRVPVTISNDGKPDKAGYLTLDFNGLVEIYSSGRLNRLVIVRDPRKHAIFVDRDNHEVVLDSRRFGVEAHELDNAERLVAAGRAQRGSGQLPSPSAVAGRTLTAKPASTSLAAWSSALVGFSFVLGALGILGGVIIALQTDDSGFGEEEYPYVLAGLGIAINAAFFGVIGIVLGKLGQAYASSTNTPPE